MAIPSQQYCRPSWEVALRRCQREATAKWVEVRPDSALIEIVPGGGKSLVQARLGHALLNADAIARGVWLVPSDHLRTEMTNKLKSVGIRATDKFRPDWGLLPSHFDGVVLTYQQVGYEPTAYRHLAVNAGVFYDEAHHCATNGLWGRAPMMAFERARYNILTTGTGFRHDEAAIAHVTYDKAGFAQALYRYPYLEGLLDRVVTPVQFEVVGADVRYKAVDGEERWTARAEDVVTPAERAERLRALVHSPAWLKRVIHGVHEQLEQLRGYEDPRAGVLFAAVDMAHARQIAELIEDLTGERAVVTLSDDAKSSEKIFAFRDGDAKYLVAVRQVSEGVDIPRLRFVVHATNTTSRLFVHQLWPRGSRYIPELGGEQWLTVYIPEDLQLLAHAKEFTGAVELYGRELKARKARKPTENKREPSQFEVLESKAHVVATVRSGEVLEHLSQAAPAPALHAGEDFAAALPASLAVVETEDDRAAMYGVVADYREVQKRRESVNAMVRRLARLTGIKHQRIHGELRRRCGQSLERASPAQIAKRLDV